MPEEATSSSLDRASDPIGPRRDLVGALRRRSRVVLIAFLGLSAGAVAAVVMAVPMYHADMKLLVKRDRADAVVSGAPDAAAQRADLSEAEVMSHAELIRAGDVLERVASEAGLVKQAFATQRPRSSEEALALAVNRLRRDLSVTPIKRTWLIDISYRSEDAAAARRVLDTMARVYLEKHLALDRPAGTYRFFSAQSDRAQEDLQAAQARMEDFSQANGVVSAAQEKNDVLQRLAEFDALRTQAGTQLAENNQRLSAITAELSTVPMQRTSQVRTSDDEGLLRDVKSRILALEMRRTELLQKFTPDYRGVVDVDGQLHEARTALDAARNAPLREETVADNPTRQWLDTELARVRTERQGLRARVGALTRAVSDYRSRAQVLEIRDVEQQDIGRTLKAAEDKYLLYTQKREEARISDELDRTRIANVVVAQAPSVEYKAERSPSLAMLPLLLGASLLLSFALAVLVEAFAPSDRGRVAVLSRDQDADTTGSPLEGLDPTLPKVEKDRREFGPRPLTPIEGQIG